VQVGDLVKYDPEMFRERTLSERQELPFGWMRDDYEGVEQGWIGIIIKIDEKMWGSFGGVGYEVAWSHGYVEKVYAFEIVKVVDTSQES
tara:strand:- start:627 stop:893 length:267 start_codon:yes stop_codon:yes gene_type:complete